MSYDVYIERARDTSPIAAATLAQGIAAQFRVPTEAIAERLAAGRFRVKSGVDRDAAERIAHSLEQLGAVCSVVDGASGQPLPRAPAAAPAGGPVGPSGARPEPEPSRAASRTDDYESGLSAAFGGNRDSQQSIGVLGVGDDSASFALATIDGDEGVTAPAEASAFAPDDGGAGAVSADLFAPPDAKEPLEVSLHTMALPRAAAAPPADDGLLTLMPDEGENLPGGIPVTRSTTAVPAASPLVRARRALASRVGVRIAVGAVLAVLLGFIPAHIVGAIRESSAYDTPRKNIEQADADYNATEVATRDDRAEVNARLDKQRADQIAILHGRRTSIALTGGVVWLLVAAGLGWLWLAKIDWDRWAD